MPAELLPWDTAFWGLRIGRVRGERLDAERLGSIDDWAAREQVGCLYFVGEDEPETVRTAERGGFDLVESRLTLTHRVGEGELPAITGDLEVRGHRPDDVPGLEALARRTPYVSRFVFDERFARERVADYYAAWVTFADAVLVAESDGRLDGYITCRLPAGGGDAASLGIVAVEEERWQSGVADALLVEAVGWLAGRGAATVSVDVAARNVRTQRYVQRHGFHTTAFRLVFHKWYR
ncbi:MAG: GNAT family N-acetyltransferase [Gaiellaceae bacterium]